MTFLSMLLKLKTKKKPILIDFTAFLYFIVSKKIITNVKSKGQGRETKAVRLTDVCSALSDAVIK